ncbi:26602_t:CDS:2, partial [Dentiscutata erythropus]
SVIQCCLVFIYVIGKDKKLLSSDARYQEVGNFQIQQPTQLGSLQSPAQQQTQSSAQSLTQTPLTPKVLPQAMPQLTAFMQTVLQSVNPIQILAIQEHLRHSQSRSV